MAKDFRTDVEFSNNLTISGNLTASVGTASFGDSIFRTSGNGISVYSSASIEGGQINFYGGSGSVWSGSYMQIDNYAGDMRILYGNGSGNAMTIANVGGAVTINTNLTASTGTVSLSSNASIGGVAIVGTTTSQTLTNKTVDLTSTASTATAATHYFIQTGDGIVRPKTLANVQAEVIPAGLIQMYGGSVTPNGWLACDGSEKAITSYGALYAVIGTLYGALTNGSGGAGSTHFRLPDLRSRVPVGASISGGALTSGLTSRTVSSSGGAESVVLTAAQSGVPAHSHPNTLAAEAAHTHSIAHEHGITVGGGSSTTQRISAPAAFSSTSTLASQTTITSSTSGAGSSHNHTITNANNTASAASSSHENMMPWIGIVYIIKT